MDTQNNNLPFKANEVVNILQAAPGILTDNETRVTRCSNAGKSLLDTINATNGINSDEVDGQVQKFIEASKQTLKRINGSRTPITQMLTAISKRFTSLESEIDVKTSGTIPYKLQRARNEYAAKKLEEQKKHLDQESILWYFLVLKNEARGNPSGYRRNILKLCRSEEIRDLVKRTEITVNQPANKLLYLVMKHPGEVTVRLLRLAMIWYYRS